MAAPLLHMLHALGFAFRQDGPELEVKVPKGRLTPALRGRIKANKGGLLDLVRGLPVSIHQLINDIALGDALDVLKRIPDNSIDLIATDPPYGLGFMGKKWDRVLPDSRIVKECCRVLKPGAFAFFMSAPRQDVLCRMILMLEEAGFETGFSSLYWTYASGFPKAHNTSKAVDRRLGADRMVVSERTMPDMRGGNFGQGQRRYTCTTVQDALPATSEAERLEGAYGGFQPKPAVEVILVVMKPLDAKNYTAQAMKDGKGVTWMDDCRIPCNDENLDHLKGRLIHKLNSQRIGEEYAEWQKRVVNSPGQQEALKKLKEQGRFPANLVVSDGVLDDGIIRECGLYSNIFSLDAWAEANIPDLLEQVRRSLPFIITPKASKREKDAGLSDLGSVSIKGRDEGQDARNVPQKARPSDRFNTHPTVKPIQLMAYLITMGSRENDVVLDPFAGSGSTLIAAQMLKRRFIGIERELEYHRIARKRLAFHAGEMARGKGKKAA